MSKKYSLQNVYDATQDRLHYIFKEFDYIYLSFSGGKDSGVCLELLIDYIKKNNLNKKIGLVVIDLEVIYKETFNYVERVCSKYKQYIDLYYICLPFSLQNGVSNIEPYFTCWGEGVEWVREMPKYAINTNNNIFDFFYYGMEFEEFTPLLAKWFANKYGKTACVVGIRADESLNRFRAIKSENKSTYNDKSFTTKVYENVYNCYPIYDWKYSDIWVFNYKFKKDYNKIYDKFYYAGLPASKMRTCYAFGPEQKIGLNLFKEVEFETWQKLLLRVNGVTSGGLYTGTKFFGYKKIQLPKNHTWKSYTKFLLNTLPNNTKQHYIKKFKTYIKFWRKNGSALSEEVIKELIKKNIKFKRNGISNRGRKDKYAIRLLEIKDDIEINNQIEIASWRRMAMAIIKNDITCKSLGFTITKDDIFKKINKIKTASNWSNDND